MKRTMRRSIVIFVSCLLLLCILNVPVLAWEWPCPNECYYWDGYDCILIGECGVADPCPDDVHYSCIDCECICDADPYYTQLAPIIPVSIILPNNNYVVCTDQTITLICSPSTDSDKYHHCVDNVWTEEPWPDPVTLTWTAKRDSTDVGTFPNGNTGTSVDWQPPNSAGPVTVKVTATDSPLYDDSLDPENPDPTDSITVYVIDDLTVFPREAYVCVSGTKEFAAWRCVDDIATDVTSSATFSTDNTDGLMKRTTGESTGPNNNILHPGSVSASIGDDYVRAEHGETSTEDTGGDCELTVVSVDITDDAGNPITATQTVCVGQEISLKTKILPSGLTGSNWQWTIPPIVVKDYKKEDIGGGRTKAYVVELSAADLQQSTVQFYWVDGADGRDVSVSCDIEDVTCTDTVQFNVKRPTLNSFTSTTGPILVGIQVGMGWILSCGAPGDPGLDWSAQVTAPAGFGGELKFTQVIWADIQRTKTDDSTESYKIPAWWLDETDPYGGGGPWNISAGATKTITDNDSPSILLEVGYKKMNVKFMKFKLYVMFEPTGTDPIWVPIAKLDWGWTGIAESTNGGNTWTKTSGAHDTTNPSGSMTTEFPEWPDTKTGTHPSFQAD